MAALHRDRAAYPDACLEVRYEDLVRQPARRGPANLRFSRRDVRAGDAGLAGQDRAWWRRATGICMRRLRQPLSDDAIAVWRHRLSAVECFAVEACLHRELAQGSYELRFTARGWRPLFRVTAGVLRALSPLLHRGIPYLQKRRHAAEERVFVTARHAAAVSRH